MSAPSGMNDDVIILNPSACCKVRFISSLPMPRSVDRARRTAGQKPHLPTNPAPGDTMSFMASLHPVIDKAFHFSLFIRHR
jgi:hypothetical protein